MAKIIIDIPAFNNFKQELDVSDKYAYRISKIIQKELKELAEKLAKKEIKQETPKIE